MKSLIRFLSIALSKFFAPSHVLENIHNSTLGSHRQCELTGMRRATFISFRDLLQGFWAWLECANLMLMTLWEINAVTEIIWSVLRVGTWVYHKSMGRSQIVEKDTDKNGKLRLWLRNRGKSYAVSPLELAVIL